MNISKSSRRQSGRMGEEFQVTIRHARRNMVDTNIENTFEEVDEKNEIEAYKKFIKSKFQSVECAFFKEDPKNSTDKEKRCFCGEIQNKHKKDESPYDREPKWDQNKCMKIFPTKDFGQIEFLVEDAVHSKPTEFVRLRYKDDMKDVMENVMDLLFNYWKIKIGSLCISVIGGAKNFKMGPKDKAIFTQGLVKAAQTTNALIITSGLNLGITRVVGDALQEGHTLHFDKKKHNNTLCCLGISPWGYVMNRKRLEKVKGELVPYKESNEIKAKQPVSLNKNHTHYIFVDEGRRNGFANTEAGNFRARLEKDLAQQNGSREAIPVVLVVVEGGNDVFVEAKRSVEENVPLVICDGTGRASDILGEAYRAMLNVKRINDEFRHFPEHFLNNLRNKLIDLMFDLKKFEEMKVEQKESSMKKVNEAIEHIEVIVQNESLITLFDMKNTEDLDVAILYSLIKKMKDPSSNVQTSICNQILLCLTWNRVDIAKEKIFKDNVELSKDEWNKILDETLKSWKYHFMELFLHNGATIQSYLTVYSLNSLYKDSVKTENFKNTIRYHLKKEFTRGLEDVKDLLVKMIGVCNLQKYRDTERNSTMKSVTSSEQQNADMEEFRRPFLELFLWAVLMEKYELAKIFWERCEESILLCLVATKIFMMIAKGASFQETERLEMLEKWKNYYESAAIKVLEECNDINLDSAAYLIEKKNPLFGNLTCLELAHRADDKRFISSMVCQNSIDFTWRSGLKVGFPRCFFGIFFPCLIRKSETYEKESSTESTSEGFSGTEVISMTEKLQSFYTAPQTKFWIHLTIHIAFLLYFSAVVLYLMKRYTITEHEILLMVYLILSIMDKTIEMFTFRSISSRNNVLEWWSYRLWNKVDVVVMVLSVIAMLLRVQWNTYAMTNWVIIYRSSKTIYSIIVGYLYLKLLRFIMIHPNLGPKMVMIDKMIQELFLYLIIIVIILLAYGVTSQAAYYPERKFYAYNLSNILDTPYWTLFGELSLQSTVYLTWCDDTRTNYSGPNDCPELNIVVPMLYSIYIFMGNILLLNVLIAIFSKIFQDIHQNSIVIWKFNMYSLVLEYKEKPILPTPFSIIFYIIRGIRHLCQRRCSFRKTISKNRIENIHDKRQTLKRQKSSEMNESFESDEGKDMYDEENPVKKSTINQLKTFENHCQSSFLSELKLEKQKTIEWAVAKIEDRLKKLSTQVSVITAKIEKFENFGSVNKALLEPSEENRRSRLQKDSSIMEDKVFDMSNCTNMILEELREMKHGYAVVDQRQLAGNGEIEKVIKKLNKKLNSLTDNTKDAMKNIQTVIEDQRQNQNAEDLHGFSERLMEKEETLRNMFCEINLRDDENKAKLQHLEETVDKFKQTMENSMKTLECILKKVAK